MSSPAALTWGFMSSKMTLSGAKYQAIGREYRSVVDAFADQCRRLDPKKYSALQQDLSSEYAAFCERLTLLGISVVCCDDEDFPLSLGVLDDVVIALFYQGSLSVLQAEGSFVSVVGARDLSVYGKSMIGQLLEPIISRVVVVSGLAFGADKEAHLVATQHGVPTIAVVGSGLDDASFYPTPHIGLKNQIVEQGGLVLSEYAPGTPPSRFSFPRRNRIIAALSPVTLVVQANIKSGSLITASVARDLGKTVCTIPARLTDTDFSGNILLLGQGAQLITSSEDLATTLSLSSSLPTITQTSIQFTNEHQKLVFELLTSSDALGFDSILNSTALNTAHLTTTLTMLELSGYICQNTEGKWAKSV
jgi:DNA processing protein